MASSHLIAVDLRQKAMGLCMMTESDRFWSIIHHNPRLEQTLRLEGHWRMDSRVRTMLRAFAEVRRNGRLAMCSTSVRDDTLWSLARAAASSLARSLSPSDTTPRTHSTPYWSPCAERSATGPCFGPLLRRYKVRATCFQCKLRATCFQCKLRATCSRSCRLRRSLW